MTSFSSEMELVEVKGYRNETFAATFADYIAQLFDKVATFKVESM